MGEQEAGREGVRAGPSTRAVALAAAAILVLLPLALWTALLVTSVRGTHAALKNFIWPDILFEEPLTSGTASTRDVGQPFAISDFRVFPDSSEDAEERVRKLGGRTRAARRLSFYLNLPDWVAPEERKRNAVILLGYCGEEAVPALTRALESPDLTVRYEAALGLGRIGPPAEPAVPALERLLNTSEQDILSSEGNLILFLTPRDLRLTAATAIWRITGRWDPLVDEVNDSSHPGFGYAFSNAAIAIGKAGPEAKAAVPGLVALLKDRQKNPPSDVAWEWMPDAIWALGQIGPDAAEAVPVLERYAGDREASPSWDEAAVALKKIRGEKEETPEGRE